jgi:hypothetical protein
MRAVIALQPRRIGGGGRRTDRLSVNETDRKFRARQTDATAEGPDGAATPRRFRPNLNVFWEDSRLEHELQTAYGAAARKAPPRALGRRRHHAMQRNSSELPTPALRARLRLSSSLRVAASLACPAVLPRTGAGGGRKRRPPRSRHHRWGDRRGGRAGCPDATQPEPFTVSPSFIRPSAVNWQGHLWDRAGT